MIAETLGDSRHWRRLPKHSVASWRTSRAPSLAALLSLVVYGAYTEDCGSSGIPYFGSLPNSKGGNIDEPHRHYRYHFAHAQNVLSPWETLQLSRFNCLVQKFSLLASLLYPKRAALRLSAITVTCAGFVKLLYAKFNSPGPV